MAFVEDTSQYFVYGDAVEFDGDTFQGLYDEAGSTANVGGVPVATTEPMLTYPSSAAKLKRGSIVSINGRAFEVRSIDPQDDGKISRATLKKV